jgi:hypothetical protein
MSDEVKLFEVVSNPQMHVPDAIAYERGEITFEELCSRTRDTVTGKPLPPSKVKFLAGMARLVNQKGGPRNDG